jgi:hypothetical protein
VLEYFIRLFFVQLVSLSQFRFLQITVVRLGLVQSAHHGALSSMARVQGVAEDLARFHGLVGDLHSGMASCHRVMSRARQLFFICYK